MRLRGYLTEAALGLAEICLHHRVWGRLLYNPDADSGSLAPVFERKQFGPGAPDVEAALANASRILPIITTAHAAVRRQTTTYWPEVYLNQSMSMASNLRPVYAILQPREYSATSARSTRSYFHASTISRTSC